MTWVGYRLNGRALLARIIYRWHWRVLMMLSLLLGVTGVFTGLIPPFLRGTVSMVVIAAPGAAITVDDRAWPFPLYAGEHTVRAALPDGRASWTTVDLQAGQPLTLTLPSGLPTPRVRPILPAAPGTAVSAISWADGAWRVQSSAVGSSTVEPQRVGVGGQPALPLPAQTVAITADGLEPLPTLDAYGGRADEVTVNGTRYEAVYRGDERRGRATGVLEIRGWDDTPFTVPLSQTLTLVRWSPTGDALLLGEQIGTDAEQLRVLRRDGTIDTVVAVPGRVREVVWSPDGSGVLLASQQHAQLTLTLARLTPTVAARVIAEVSNVDAARGSGGAASGSRTQVQMEHPYLPPVHWNGTTLEWIGADAQGVSHLWSAPLLTLIPERGQVLPAVALTRLAHADLRVVAIRNEQVVIAQLQGTILLVETVIPDVPATVELRGQWSPLGNQLILQSATDAWIVDLPMEAPAAAGSTSSRLHRTRKA